jgi:hypothetical protein
MIILKRKGKEMKKISLLLFALCLLVPYGVFAQQASPQFPTTPDQMKMRAEAVPGMTTNPRIERCRRMVAEHDRMMSKMKEMDDRLKERMAAMQAAQGDEKINAMAAVVDELVRQHDEMRARMMAMQQKGTKPMMSGQMGRRGMMGRGCPMCPMCPMMQEMGGSAESDMEFDSAPGAQHGEHHN